MSSNRQGPSSHLLCAGRKQHSDLNSPGNGYSHSDTETTTKQSNTYQGNNYFSIGDGSAAYGSNSTATSKGYNNNSHLMRGFGTGTSLPDNTSYYHTDEENPVDEFDESNNGFAGGIGNKVIRTGRQRKKLAARSKGGEFQARRMKRRVYFCCVSSDIDIQKLHEYLLGLGILANGWKYQLRSEVLHLFRSGFTDTAVKPIPSMNPYATIKGINNGSNSNVAKMTSSSGNNIDFADGSKETRGGFGDDQHAGLLSDNNDSDIGESPRDSRKKSSDDRKPVGGKDRSGREGSAEKGWVDDLKIASAGAQEVFIFDFGAAVFWNFSRGEETNLLKTIRMFVTKGLVAQAEFVRCHDDMAFVASPEVESISIANDVITIPEDTQVRQRLSVSFAIAQSTVLAIFEARVEIKVEEYKYIPESLAATGKVHLSERQLGIMIGEVFVIRHDVNLHTEILDTPDFFWKEEKYEQDYKLVMRYLEMSERTEVLNKRLDMLRELLDVLQQQMENSHSLKLEWIVIWLIVIEVALQVLTIGGQSLGWFEKVGR